MGNTEVTQLVYETPLNSKEVTRLQQLYETHGNSFVVERSIFASLFDASKISFHIIDRIFDSFDKDSNGCISMSDLVVGLVCCGRMPLENKLRFLFNVFQQNGDERLTLREFKRIFCIAIQNNVTRVRGKSNRWPARECAGCKRNPDDGFIYSCKDCCSCFILGVPLTVNLCSNCVSWEGIYEENCDAKQRHTLNHELSKQGIEAESQSSGIFHVGVQCDNCGMLPIVGPRHHCTECKDLLELCDACFKESAEPLAHSITHPCETVSCQQTEEEQVMFFINDLLFGLAEGQDKILSMDEFLEWGMQSELINNILLGFQMQYISLSAYEESVEAFHESYHEDPQIGRIEPSELSELSKKSTK